MYTPACRCESGWRWKKGTQVMGAWVHGHTRMHADAHTTVCPIALMVPWKLPPTPAYSHTYLIHTHSHTTYVHIHTKTMHPSAATRVPPHTIARNKHQTQPRSGGHLKSSQVTWFRNTENIPYTIRPGDDSKRPTPDMSPSSIPSHYAKWDTCSSRQAHSSDMDVHIHNVYKPWAQTYSKIPGTPSCSHSALTHTN